MVAPASKDYAILWGTADSVAPALHGIQQEPAWPSIMDGHQPEDWPLREPPPSRGCHLFYLQVEAGLNHETLLAIHSFYVFMLVSLTWTAFNTAGFHDAGNIKHGAEQHCALCAEYCQ